MLLPYTTLTYYGPGAAAMALDDGIGVGTMESQPVMNKRTGVTVIGTGTADILRPYRGYAANLSVSGDSYVAITPHQLMKMGLKVAVGAVPSAEDITQSVWNAAATRYNYAGTMGQKLNNAASGGVDYSALGLAVWDVLTSSMSTSGSAGEQLKNALTTSKFLALKD